LEPADLLGGVEADHRIADLDLLALGREVGDLEVPHVGQRRRLDLGRIDRLEHAGDLDADHQVVAGDLDEPRRARTPAARQRERRDRQRPPHGAPPIITTSPAATPVATAQACALHAPSVTARSSPLAIRTRGAPLASGASAPRGTITAP